MNSLPNKKFNNCRTIYKSFFVKRRFSLLPPLKKPMARGKAPVKVRVPTSGTSSGSKKRKRGSSSTKNTKVTVRTSGKSSSSRKLKRGCILDKESDRAYYEGLSTLMIEGAFTDREGKFDVFGYLQMFSNADFSNLIRIVHTVHSAVSEAVICLLREIALHIGGSTDPKVQVKLNESTVYSKAIVPVLEKKNVEDTVSWAMWTYTLKQLESFCDDPLRFATGKHKKPFRFVFEEKEITSPAKIIEDAIGFSKRFIEQQESLDRIRSVFEANINSRNKAWESEISKL